MAWSFIRKGQVAGRPGSQITGCSTSSSIATIYRLQKLHEKRRALNVCKLTPSVEPNHASSALIRCEALCNAVKFYPYRAWRRSLPKAYELSYPLALASLNLAD
jgi:hypothetical protein